MHYERRWKRGRNRSRFYQARLTMPRLDSPNPAPPPQAAAPHPLAGQSANTGARLRTVIREIAATRKVNQISTRDVLLALITRPGEPWGACGVAKSRVATCAGLRGNWRGSCSPSVLFRRRSGSRTEPHRRATKWPSSMTTFPLASPKDHLGNTATP
jgi:hypothetical protein